jgi:hypothetical protein
VGERITVHYVSLGNDFPTCVFHFTPPLSSEENFIPMGGPTEAQKRRNRCGTNGSTQLKSVCCDSIVSF